MKAIDKTLMHDKAIETLEGEAKALKDLTERIDDDFVKAAEAILSCKGRIIVTGMGKSGHVGRKIAATLASTGTPSFFMHPAEAFHGDLGMVTPKDLILAISNSGETNEVVNILPVLRRIGAQIIALCGRKNSTLVRNADYFLDVTVEKEAGPLGIAPTTSTTATLAMGDALAMAVLAVRDFTEQDFAMYHPGGSLGRKLLLTVEKIMRSGDDNPTVFPNTKVKDALFEMTAKGVGATTVIDENHRVLGILTDGDLRRCLKNGSEFLNEPVEKFMTKQPLTVTKERLAATALSLMEQHQPRPITVLPVVNSEKENVSIGILHITDLLRQGVV